MYAKESTKPKAIKLRKEGYSYSIISQKIGVPKSTLSYWLRKIEYKPNEFVLKRVRKSRIKGVETKRKRKGKEKE